MHGDGRKAVDFMTQPLGIDCISVTKERRMPVGSALLPPGQIVRDGDDSDLSPKVRTDYASQSRGQKAYGWLLAGSWLTEAPVWSSCAYQG